MKAIRAPAAPLAGADRIAVLLAEGDSTCRSDIADVLQHAGWKVIEAATADVAIALLAMPIRIDAVVTANVLPGRASGLDVARIAAIKRPSAAVALITDHGGSNDGERLWHILLPKPFAARTLLQLLRTVLPQRWPCEHLVNLKEHGERDLGLWPDATSLC